MEHQGLAGMKANHSQKVSVVSQVGDYTHGASKGRDGFACLPWREPPRVAVGNCLTGDRCAYVSGQVSLQPLFKVPEIWR